MELFVEVGPGKVLSGLVRQIDRAAECLRVEDSATLNEVVARLARRVRIQWKAAPSSECATVPGRIETTISVIQSDGSW